MTAGGFAPSAWRVQKVCPLANRSFANFPLSCSPPHCNLVSQSRTQEQLARKTVPPGNCAHMPKSPNAGCHPGIYSTHSTPILTGGQSRAESCLLLPLFALCLRTSEDSEFGPKKSPGVGKVPCAESHSNTPPTPPPPPPPKKKEKDSFEANGAHPARGWGVRVEVRIKS